MRQVAKAETRTPSRPRRPRHCIEEVRGHKLDRQPEATLTTLEKAHANAPETILYNGYARRIILEEAEAEMLERRWWGRRPGDKAGVLAWSSASPTWE